MCWRKANNLKAKSLVDQIYIHIYMYIIFWYMRIYIKDLYKLHSFLRFTMEEENNRELPFLDVLFERRDSSFLISVYRKPTITRLYLCWHSFAPRSKKLNLIRCLSYRALNICSDCKIEDELKVIRDIFINNGYPKEVIDDNIKFTETWLKNENKTFGPPKCPVYFRLPWVGSASQFFAERIASSVYRCYHSVMYLSLPPTRHDLTQGQKPEGRLKWG